MSNTGNLAAKSATVFCALGLGAICLAQVQDLTKMSLEDLMRIEVVSARGPGWAMWGVNAVNGVVNIVTRTAEESPGISLKNLLQPHPVESIPASSAVPTRSRGRSRRS